MLVFVQIAMMLPPIFICFATSEQKLWNNERNLRNDCSCLSLTSVSSHAVDWGDRKGTFHGVKSQLIPLHHSANTELSSAELQCWCWGQSSTSGADQSESDPLTPWNLNTQSCYCCLSWGFEDVGTVGTSAAAQSPTELLFPDKFLLCPYCILKLP